MQRHIQTKEEQESSIRGFVLRQLIAHMTNDHLIGQKIKSGEIRKRMVEPKWHCPLAYTNEEIILPDFTMELLRRKEGERKDYVILQLHGGGYIGGMRNAYRKFAVLYCELTDGMDVLTVDYRVAPEHPFPAALLDAAEAYEWLLSHGYKSKQILLVGDSAGGGLELGLCMHLKNQGKELPGGIVAMSPWTDLTASGPSYTFNYENDPLFGKSQDTLIYNKDYVKDHDPTDPCISPIFGDYTDFPPMLIQVGSIEMLLSDSEGVAQKAKAAGVDVTLTVYEGMFHIFQMAMRLLPESSAAWDEIGVFLNRIAPETKTGEPVDEPTDEPTGEPADEPTEKLTDEPADKPEGELAETGNGPDEQHE